MRVSSCTIDAPRRFKHKPTPSASEQSSSRTMTRSAVALARPVLRWGMSQPIQIHLSGGLFEEGSPVMRDAAPLGFKDVASHPETQEPSESNSCETRDR